jgi:hypothetical protein
MGEVREGCEDVLVPVDAGLQVGGGVVDHAIAKAVAAKASAAALRKIRREEKLMLQADAAVRKKLQEGRTLENASKKHAREKDTIARYFTSTRNFDATATAVKENIPSTKSLASTDGDNFKVLVAVAIEGLATLPASVDAISIVGASTSSSDVHIIGGSAPPLTVSTDSSALSSAPFPSAPSWHIFHDVPATESQGYESEEQIELPPAPKKTRRNYELTRKFQMEWSEMLLTREGLLHMVKCGICTAVRGHPIIMGPKWDTVRRHAKRICHVKNTELYAQRRPTTVLQQIQGCNTVESRKKVRCMLFFLSCLFYKGFCFCTQAGFRSYQ